MGLFSDAFTRLRIPMAFDIQPRLAFGSGAAATQWEDLKPHPIFDHTRARIALVCLLYGRVLMAHKETRVELFGRVADAAGRYLAEGKPIEFDDWVLHAGDGVWTIWPWTIVGAAEIAKPKTYVATLKGDRRGVWIDLKMAWGLERILAPSSALIALWTFSRELSDDDRVLLGRCIEAMHGYYGTPDGASRLRSETRAVEVAYPLLAVPVA